MKNVILHPSVSKALRIYPRIRARLTLIISALESGKRGIKFKEVRPVREIAKGALEIRLPIGKAKCVAFFFSRYYKQAILFFATELHLKELELSERVIDLAQNCQIEMTDRLDERSE